MKKLLLILILPLLMGVGCTKINTFLDDTNVSDDSINSIVDANNKFALDLYDKYKEKGNVFFSPYSISSALAMTYEGAKGKTAEEIKEVFYFPEDQDEMRSAYASLYNDINKEDKEYALSTANALWAEKEFVFLDSYFDTVKNYYGGGVTNLDFKKNPEKSRVTINNWVEDKTNDKIKDLIPSGMIDSLTRLVLTNAVYFKGDWVKQFNEDNTKDKNFRVTPNNTVKIPMMKYTGDEAEFKYAEDNNTQIIELLYSGEELSMLILLPKNDDLNKLEKNLSIKQLSNWKEDLVKQRVDVYIPKFKFETKYFMAEDLNEMGMPTAFGEQADFSGMTGRRDLFVSQVVHQAFIEVNEEGTEAAAATAVVMKFLALPGEGQKIPVFNADHPFIFLIQQNNTGNILFMGRVNDPSK
ncbi:serpin family protein [bacterium]|nr:serpin family protein [bacterium]